MRSVAISFVYLTSCQIVAVGFVSFYLLISIGYLHNISYLQHGKHRKLISKHMGKLAATIFL